MIGCYVNLFIRYAFSIKPGLKVNIDLEHKHFVKNFCSC